MHLFTTQFFLAKHDFWNPLFLYIFFKYCAYMGCANCRFLIAQCKQEINFCEQGGTRGGNLFELTSCLKKMSCFYLTKNKDMNRVISSQGGYGKLYLTNWLAKC